MTDARYFEEDGPDVASDDTALQDMARRQFGISIVVAFALLAAAGVATVKGIHVAPAEVTAQMTAQHRIIRAEPPRVEIAQPRLNATPRG